MVRKSLTTLALLCLFISNAFAYSEPSATCVADLKDLADTNGIMWINFAAKYPTYVSLNAAGYACGDALHMNADGYDYTTLLVDALGGAL